MRTFDRPRRLRALALASLILGLLPVADAKSPAARVPPGTRIFEVRIDALRDGVGADALAAALRDSRAADQKRSGCDRNDATMLQEASRLLRATIWTTMADAEAAALVRDGSAAEVAFAKVCDPKRRQVAHFRALREFEHKWADAGYLEVVIYRTRPGTTRKRHLALFEATATDFATIEGLFAHAIGLAPDGRWVHLLHWRKRADCEKGKPALRKPAIDRWILSRDSQRATAYRGDVIAPRPEAEK